MKIKNKELIELLTKIRNKSFKNWQRLKDDTNPQTKLFSERDAVRYELTAAILDNDKVLLKLYGDVPLV